MTRIPNQTATINNMALATNATIHIARRPFCEEGDVADEESSRTDKRNSEGDSLFPAGD